MKISTLVIYLIPFFIKKSKKIDRCDRTKRFTTNEVQVNIKRLAAKGTYFAKILDSNGNVIAIKKLIYQ